MHNLISPYNVLDNYTLNQCWNLSHAFASNLIFILLVGEKESSRKTVLLFSFIHLVSTGGSLMAIPVFWGFFSG